MNKLKVFLGVCVVAGAAQAVLALPGKADFFRARPFISRGFYNHPNTITYVSPYAAYIWTTNPPPAYNYGANANPFPAYNYGHWGTNPSPSYNYVIPSQSVYPYSPAFNPSLNGPYSMPPPVSVVPQ
jgi:hypothetical protein